MKDQMTAKEFLAATFFTAEDEMPKRRKRTPQVKAAHLLDRLILADDILRQVRRIARRTGPLPISGVIAVQADAQLVRAALGKKKREA